MTSVGTETTLFIVSRDCAPGCANGPLPHTYNFPSVEIAAATFPVLLLVTYQLDSATETFVNVIPVGEVTTGV